MPYRSDPADMALHGVRVLGFPTTSRVAERFGAACTEWQVRPTRLDAMALNDHTDWRWDERVLRTLASVEISFKDLCRQLADRLARFDGYADRYSSALSKAVAGQREWVDAPDRDSCHILWIQFHEDLLATLGIPRGSDT